jgi:N-acetylglucosamine-6-sulfatase
MWPGRLGSGFDATAHQRLLAVDSARVANSLANSLALRGGGDLPGQRLTRSTIPGRRGASQTSAAVANSPVIANRYHTQYGVFLISAADCRIGFVIMLDRSTTLVRPRLIRRQRLVIWLGLAVSLLAACSYSPSASTGASQRPPTAYASSTAQAASGRPNIVFVLTDDLADNLVSQMPPVLALERNGTTFAHYDVVDSLCCPSRSAIFTGEYPHDDGVITNGPPYGGYQSFMAHGDEQHSFALSLANRGYTTAFMGKYLNGYQVGDPVAPGWDVWDAVGGDGGYHEFNYDMNVNGVPVQYGATPSDYLTNVLSRKAAAFISSAATSSSHPFFLEVATFAPHRPFVPAPKYRHAARGALYPETPAYDAQVKNPPPWLGHRARLTAAQEHTMSVIYRRRIEDDYSVNDLLTNVESALTKAGVRGNTYIVFSSDNGYHMGEYRLLSGKQTAFDSDINVPLVVSGPRVPAGHTVSALASNIDLAPTFDAIAGAPVDSNADGVSLLPLLSGRTPANWQQAVLIEHHGHDDQPGDPDAQNRAHGDPPSYEAVRTLNALYVRYVNGFEEFYNTAVDPNELDNLGGRRAPTSLKVALTDLSQCHGAAACQKAATAPFTSGQGLSTTSPHARGSLPSLG